MARIYDVAVLGATPAGYVAAICLRKTQRDVVLLDGPRDASECPLSDWAPAGTLKMTGLPKGLARSSGARRFSRVAYHNVAMDKTVQYQSSTPAGVMVSYRKLCDALRQCADQAGVRLRSTGTGPAVQLMEDRVKLVGTTQVAARLLLVAHNRPAEMLADLAMPARSAEQPQLAVAGLDVPLAKSDASRLAGALHIIEMPERSELGLFFVLGEIVHIRVISNSPASGNRARDLSEMVSRLQQAELLPGKIQLGRAKGAVWHPPAGAALEMERHVAKRCLLIGTAGGFAESITGQTIRPTMESAIIAAETAHNALAAANVQETLMGFKSAWRKRQASYLGPPSTSLRLLLPLLFVNQAIVTRFTKALLYGDDI